MDGKRPYRLEFVSDAAVELQDDIARLRGVFKPPLRELFEALEREPKQFPVKRGALAGCRAAPVRYDRTQVWRCVFEVDESAHVVRVLSLDRHDTAYEKASVRRS